MHDQVMSLFSPQQGHFLLESGYHGHLWMDLEALFLQPGRIEPLAAELASRLSPHRPELICGPLVEGAFLGLMVAQRLGLPFAYTERVESRSGDLYPFDYLLPRVLRPHVAGKRVAILNDVINAGSAVRGTVVDLERHGAQPIAFGVLLVLGEWTAKYAAEKGMAVESLAALPNELWEPERCPLCAQGVALERRIQVT